MIAAAIITAAIQTLLFKAKNLSKNPHGASANVITKTIQVCITNICS